MLPGLGKKVFGLVQIGFGPVQEGFGPGKIGFFQGKILAGQGKIGFFQKQRIVIEGIEDRPQLPWSSCESKVILL